MEKFKAYIKDNKVIEAFFAVLFYFVIMQILTSSASSLLVVILGRDTITNNLNKVNCIYELAIYILLFVPLVCWYSFDLKKDLFDFKADPGKAAKRVLLGFIFFYACSIIASLIVNAANIDTSENQTTIVELVKSSNMGLITMIITAVILGPMVEELIFRKSLFQLFKNDYISLIISSFVFGLIHILSTEGSFSYQLLVGVPYFTSGIAFGLIYIKSDRNILVSTAVHMISNLLSIIAIIAVPQFFFA